MEQEIVKYLKSKSNGSASSTDIINNLTKKKIIITGTPIANRPEDIWSQFYFLDGGKLLGKDFNEFRKKYAKSNQIKSEQLRKDNISKFFSAVCSIPFQNKLN